MKRLIYIMAIILPLVWSTGCDKDDNSDTTGNGNSGSGTQTPEQPGTDVPEGYFEVVFNAPDTKTAVSGQDGRVRDVRYLLFKSTGEFVKERHIVLPSDPISVWPLAAVRDTLPKGSYRAVFLGNAEKTLFPYATAGSTQNYTDVLTGYQNGYSSGRILLPPAEFTSTSEYYMANVAFSDASPTPYILFQRIIGLLNLHRNVVDAQVALNKLTANIFTNIKAQGLVETQLRNTILYPLIYAVLDKGPLNGVTYALIPGGIDAITAALVNTLVAPVSDAVYTLVAQQLVNQLGIVLTGNADQSGLLGYLGILLNPWATAESESAIVTINNFPQSTDFDLNVQSVYTGEHKFKYKFSSSVEQPGQEKDILIKGFKGLFDIRKINVVKQGLIAGLLLDGIVDGPWLLNGTFIDINDPIQFNNQMNKRFKSNYSLLDLGLKSYNPQTQSPQPLSVTVNLSTIPNIDGIITGIPLLGPVLGTITSLIIAPVKTIKVVVPVNLPLLGVENLKLSGGWDTPTQY